MKRLLFFSFMFFLLFASSSSATWIFGTNSTGDQKNLFFTNETIYVASGNISNSTTNSLSVRIYIVNNSDSWSNNTRLVDASGGYTVVSTNSSGYITPTSFWASPTAGNYDIIADVNLDGNYTSNTDYVDNLTVNGIQIISTPVPVLTVSKGPNSPSDHTWDLGNTSKNVMLQLKLTASNENLRIDTVWLDANGTGNDNTGISFIQLILDQNNNSIYDTGETSLGYGTYANDDGLLPLSLGDGYTISSNSSVFMILLYSISPSVSSGDTFSFNVLTISAVGIDSGKAATISGLTINSAVKTMGSATPSPDILCSDYANETSCSDVACEWCNTTDTCKNATEVCPTCVGPVELSLERHGNTSTAHISGMSGCDGETAYLRQDSCTDSDIGDCSVSGTDCWVSFDTPASPGNYTYFGCVDMDASGNFTSGETASGVLEVAPPEEEAPLAFMDWNMIILIVAVVALIAGIVFVVFWLTRAKPSKQYTFKFESQ